MITFLGKVSVTMREKALYIVKRLHEKGYKAYFCGGCVRDFLLGIHPKDYDIVTNASPEKIKEIFPRTVSVGAKFGIIQVLYGNETFEVATFRQDGEYQDGRRPILVNFGEEKEDALRRDFTINGLFLEPETNQIIDYVGGQEDIKARLIRTIGNPQDRFQEDHLRLLRAIRFCCQLDFSIEEQTWKTIQCMSGFIQKISKERIRDEILKMLMGKNPSKAIFLLEESGLLKEILPEVSSLKQEICEKSESLFHLTLRLLEKGTPFKSMEIAFFALLYNLEKIPCKQKAKDIIKDICVRLRFPWKSIQKILDFLKWYKKFDCVPKMELGDLKKFLRLSFFPDLLEFYRIQCLAENRNLNIYHDCQKNLLQFQNHLAPPPLITGYDLLHLGFKPGPMFKEMLEFIEKRQLEGIVSSREEAIHLLKQKWGNSQ